jgi:hypothetical protein
MVSWGVGSRGVVGPKAAMEEGVKRAAPVSRAASRRVMSPPRFTRYASWGFFSPTAERRAARW